MRFTTCCDLLRRMERAEVAESKGRRYELLDKRDHVHAHLQRWSGER